VDFSGNVKKFGRIEKLYFKKENIWKLYGEGGKLLTGCPLHEIGEHTEHTEAQPKEYKKVLVTHGIHKGKEVKDTPASWREWFLKEVTVTKWNRQVFKEITRLNEHN
jgi:hypothetical protein